MKTNIIIEILFELIKRRENWQSDINAINEAIEKLKQAELELEELKQKANAIYKLKCVCDKCGHEWVERMEKSLD